MKHDMRPGSVGPAGGDARGDVGQRDDKYGPALRVPPQVLQGERKEEQPCLTPIDCVLTKRCAGHCGCR